MREGERAEFVWLKQQLRLLRAALDSFGDR
jgi:hypothetical protein